MGAKLGAKVFDGDPLGTAALGALGGLAGGALGAVVGQRADICRNFLEQEYLALSLAKEQLGIIVAKFKETDDVDADFLKGLAEIDHDLLQHLAFLEKLRFRSINPLDFKAQNEVFEQGLAVRKNILALVKKIDAISHDLNL